MDYVTLGRTQLRVSVMGLGCGGHSRLGLATGKTEAEAENIVREALALGVNFIDTAEAYGTEEVVGRALAGTAREQVVLSTKAGVGWKERRSTGAELKERAEASLRRLRTDYLDVYHLHGVSADDYPYAQAELVPALQALQAEGKIRFPGITEQFINDPGHRMLALALADGWCDVVMVGFSLLNQSARERVLADTRRQNIGTLCMFAVRRALSQPEALRSLMADLAARDLIDSQIDSQAFDPADPLGFLTADGLASSVPDAAYRFCRWEPGMDVVLSGTGNVDHLEANAASLLRPALPDATIERLRHLFARVDSISGN
jgi:aryl-alcohol dehydrogenase-like predicted oxidoreductase